MKLLLVSWHYPPTNAIAAQRTGRMAEFFRSRGHQVSVLTVAKPGQDKSLAFGLKGIEVEETDYQDIDERLNPLDFLRRIIGRNASQSQQKSPESSNSSSSSNKPAQPSLLSHLKDKVRKVYHELCLFPDKYRGWDLTLGPALKRQFATNPPDIVIVTGPPFSSFETVARETGLAGIPWVAEFRDRWMDDPYDDWSGWRYHTGQRREGKTIRRAAGIVTVSPDWADFYRGKYQRPTACVMNGFDPALFAEVVPPPETGLPLTLCHMGQGYANQRDPTPLFQALKRSGIQPGQVLIRFYGNNLDFFSECVKQEQVEEFVEILPAVSHAQSVAIQRQTDILFLMQSPRQSDAGNVPAKLFEYLGAKRPIIAVGCEGGVVNRIIDERGAGLLSNAPAKLAHKLEEWVKIKEKTGTVPHLPDQCIEGVARADQLAEYERFLLSLLDRN